MSNFTGVVSRVFRFGFRFSPYKSIRTCSLVKSKLCHHYSVPSKIINCSIFSIGFIPRRQATSMTALSPNDPASYSRPDVAIIRHIDLKLNVDFEQKLLSGCALLKFEALQDVDEVALDASNLTIKSVELENGTALKYKVSEYVPNFGSKLTVELPHTIRPVDKNEQMDILTYGNWETWKKNVKFENVPTRTVSSEPNLHRRTIFNRRSNMPISVIIEDTTKIRNEKNTPKVCNISESPDPSFSIFETYEKYLVTEDIKYDIFVPKDDKSGCNVIKEKSKIAQDCIKLSANITDVEVHHKNCQDSNIIESSALSVSKIMENTRQEYLEDDPNKEIIEKVEHLGSTVNEYTTISNSEIISGYETGIGFKNDQKNPYNAGCGRCFCKVESNEVKLTLNDKYENVKPEIKSYNTKHVCTTKQCSERSDESTEMDKVPRCLQQHRMFLNKNYVSVKDLVELLGLKNCVDNKHSNKWENECCCEIPTSLFICSCLGKPSVMEHCNKLKNKCSSSTNFVESLCLGEPNQPKHCNKLQENCVLPNDLGKSTCLGDPPVLEHCNQFKDKCASTKDLVKSACLEDPPVIEHCKQCKEKSVSKSYFKEPSVIDRCNRFQENCVSTTDLVKSVCLENPPVKNHCKQCKEKSVSKSYFKEPSVIDRCNRFQENCVSTTDLVKSVCLENPPVKNHCKQFKEKCKSKTYLKEPFVIDRCNRFKENCVSKTDLVKSSSLGDSPVLEHCNQFEDKCVSTTKLVDSSCLGEPNQPKHCNKLEENCVLTNDFGKSTCPRDPHVLEHCNQFQENSVSKTYFREPSILDRCNRFRENCVSTTDLLKSLCLEDPPVKNKCKQFKEKCESKTYLKEPSVIDRCNSVQENCVSTTDLFKFVCLEDPPLKNHCKQSKYESKTYLKEPFVIDRCNSVQENCVSTTDLVLEHCNQFEDKCVSTTNLVESACLGKPNQPKHCNKLEENCVLTNDLRKSTCPRDVPVLKYCNQFQENSVSKTYFKEPSVIDRCNSTTDLVKSVCLENPPVKNHCKQFKCESKTYLKEPFVIDRCNSVQENWVSTTDLVKSLCLGDSPVLEHCSQFEDKCVSTTNLVESACLGKPNQPKHCNNLKEYCVLTNDLGKSTCPRDPAVLEHCNQFQENSVSKTYFKEPSVIDRCNRFQENCVSTTDLVKSVCLEDPPVKNHCKRFKEKCESKTYYKEPFVIDLCNRFQENCVSTTDLVKPSCLANSPVLEHCNRFKGKCVSTTDHDKSLYLEEPFQMTHSKELKENYTSTNDLVKYPYNKFEEKTISATDLVKFSCTKKPSAIEHFNKFTNKCVSTTDLLKPLCCIDPCLKEHSNIFEEKRVSTTDLVDTLRLVKPSVTEYCNNLEEKGVLIKGPVESYIKEHTVIEYCCNRKENCASKLDLVKSMGFKKIAQIDHCNKLRENSVSTTEFVKSSCFEKPAEMCSSAFMQNSNSCTDITTFLDEQTKVLDDILLRFIDPRLNYIEESCAMLRDQRTLKNKPNERSSCCDSCKKPLKMVNTSMSKKQQPAKSNKTNRNFGIYLMLETMKNTNRSQINSKTLIKHGNNSNYPVTDGKQNSFTKGISYANKDILNEDYAESKVRENKETKFSIKNTTIHIENRFNIRIQYTTAPTASALQWLDPMQTSGKKYPYLFSQCQPIHARSILPCQDSPAVKFTYTAEITAPEPFTVLMSALPDERKSTKTTFHQPVPIPSYLLALAVGVLESRTIGPRTKVWAEKEEIEKSAWEFAETENYIKAAEKLCGPYVWKQYDLLVLPPSFPYGGMENPCLTFVTPSLLAGDRSQADVIVHEIMHSWTGNLVTNKNFEHFWLNEGFTVFLERKVASSLIENATEAKKNRDFQSLLGLQELSETVKSEFVPTSPLTCLVVNLTGVHPDSSFSTVPYEKGSTLLRYLEDIIGIEVFDDFLRSYLNHFQRQSLDTDQFKAYLFEYFKNTEHSEKLAHVDWKTWLYTPGMPPIIPDYDTSMTKDVTNLLAKIGHENVVFSANDIKGFTPHQIINFLQELIDRQPLPIDKLEALGAAYKVSSNQNSEIKYRWFRLCVRSKAISRLPEIFDFVNHYGRMKYVRPIYRDLYAWEDVRKDAIANFLKNESNMMHVSAYTVRKDLHLSDPILNV